MPTFRYVGLPVLLAKVEAAATAAVNHGANHLVSEAQSAAPVDTGALAASIHTDGARRSGNGVEATISTGGEVSEYAVPQHEGAGPHVIRPKTAKALHFNGTFAKQVNHPGNPPTKFLEEPLLQMAPAFKAYCAAAMRGQF